MKLTHIEIFTLPTDIANRGGRNTLIYMIRMISPKFYINNY